MFGVPVSLLELRVGGTTSGSRNSQRAGISCSRSSGCSVGLEVRHTSVEVGVAWRHVLLGSERVGSGQVERGLLGCSLLLLRLTRLKPGAWDRAGVGVGGRDGHARAEASLVAVAVRPGASCKATFDFLYSCSLQTVSSLVKIKQENLLQQVTTS